MKVLLPFNKLIFLISLPWTFYVPEGNLTLYQPFVEWALALLPWSETLCIWL